MHKPSFHWTKHYYQFHSVLEPQILENNNKGPLWIRKQAHNDWGAEIQYWMRFLSLGCWTPDSGVAKPTTTSVVAVAWLLVFLKSRRKELSALTNVLWSFHIDYCLLVNSHTASSFSFLAVSVSHLHQWMVSIQKENALCLIESSYVEWYGTIFQQNYCEGTQENLVSFSISLKTLHKFSTFLLFSPRVHWV